MKTIFLVSICAAFLLVGGMATLTGSAPQTSPRASHSGDVERGKYLVEDVAKCAECHTPRDAQGQLDTQRWLQGAPTWIAPVQPVSNWALRVPAIAGFPAYSDEDAVNILEKGIGTDGQPIRPPMHIYHFNHEDALAVVAYLRSLPATPQ